MLLNNNLIELNRVDNEMEQIFNGYLSASGISMTTMWILYSAYTGNGTTTQREICDNWFCAPQTINSAMKLLEKNGVIELLYADGNRKSKQVHLTQIGIEMCERLIYPLISAENEAISSLTVDEQTLLVALLAKYKNALKQVLVAPEKEKA